MTLPSASKDNPTCFLPEQEYSDSLFPLVSMTMTPPSVLYAIFLPQNDEQMTGQSLNGNLVGYILLKNHSNEM